MNRTAERFRLGLLLGAEVRGPDGEHIGVVEDVRLEADGPPQGAGMARLRVRALVVSPRRHVRLWGYERRPDIGPWLVRAIVRRLSRGAHNLDRDDFTIASGPRDRLVVHSRLPKDHLPLTRDIPAR
jgi:sporulation protein YlmC with PRC-barrel domain